VTVRGVVDVTLQTDAGLLEHRSPRIDAPLLAAITLVLDEISVEVRDERIEDSLPNDIVEGLARTRRRGFKRHDHHLRREG
jgi:hypothetical protein